MNIEETKRHPITIPGDTVTQALARLVGEGELDDAARAEVQWFYSYCMENAATLEEAGKASEE